MSSWVPSQANPIFFVEAAGVFILPQDKEKDLKIALAAQAAEDFLHELGAIALPFMVWVGIKGDDLSQPSYPRELNLHTVPAWRPASIRAGPKVAQQTGISSSYNRRS